jgi:hypothetical protein
MLFVRKLWSLIPWASLDTHPKGACMLGSVYTIYEQLEQWQNLSLTQVQAWLSDKLVKSFDVRNINKCKSRTVGLITVMG